jgi:hypothetical protein
MPILPIPLQSVADAVLPPPAVNAAREKNPIGKNHRSHRAEERPVVTRFAWQRGDDRRAKGRNEQKLAVRIASR